MGTHQLKSVEGGIDEHMEKRQVIEGHSHAREHIGRDK